MATKGILRLADILEFFFVAHPSSGRREGEEHQRIMYFYPKGETLDRQVRNWVQLNVQVENVVQLLSGTRHRFNFYGMSLKQFGFVVNLRASSCAAGGPCTPDSRFLVYLFNV